MASLSIPPNMSRARLVAEAVHMLALGIWFGGLGVAGASAGQVFRTMRELNPSLPDFQAYDGAHWSIAAGRAVLPLFFAVDVVQFVCLLLAGGMFALATGFFGLSLRRLSTFLRAFVLLALIAVLSYRFFALQPGMMTSLYAYWDAAAAGQSETALRHKELFDAGHVLDRRLMMATMLLVVAGIAAAIWSLLDTRAEALPRAESTPELEVPDLARRAR